VDATLLIAVLGLVLAVLSLAWQAWTWSRSGPVLSLSTSNQFPSYADHLGDHLVCLTVVNKGRAATTIQAWGIELPDGGNIVSWNNPPWFTQLPQRLEPHASVDLRIDAEELRQVAAERSVPFDSMRPWVRAGDGRQYYARGVPLS
jgi:hypothetical protein